MASVERNELYIRCIGLLSKQTRLGADEVAVTACKFWTYAQFIHFFLTQLIASLTYLLRSSIFAKDLLLVSYYSGKTEYYLVLMSVNSTGTLYITDYMQPSRDKAAEGFVRRVEYLMTRRVSSAEDMIR